MIASLEHVQFPFAASLYAFAVFAMIAETVLFAFVARPRDKRSRWLGIRSGALSFGMGAVFSSLVTVSAQMFVYEHRVIDLGFGPVAWVSCFLINDVMFYVSHRMAHRVRLLWSVHCVHHSSRHFDLTAGVRGSVFDALVQFPFAVWIPILGIHPLIVVLLETAFRFYGLGYHTDLVDKLGVVDDILVTPSNHRVHHGCDDAYLDVNYGGFFILWDRLCGTFVRETARPTYGLKKPWHGYGTLDCQLHELRDLARDLRRTRGIVAKLRVALGPP